MDRTGTPVGVGPPGIVTPGAAALPIERRLAEVARPIVWCDAGDRIRDVARRISTGDHSCALIHTNAGLGIITDHDFRHRVGTGEIGIDSPASALATVPALTLGEEATQAAGLLRMVEHAVHHLVVTDGGGRPLGVVRAVDLAQATVRDPLLIRSAIDTATTLDDVAHVVQRLPATIVALCDSRVDAMHIGALHAAVVDAILRRLLHLRRDSVLGQVRHSWVLLGSLARRESLPLSDVDTALVWADPPPAAADVTGPIRAAAAQIIEDVRRCGLVPCPNGNNADNPTFSRARSAWISAVADWRQESAGGHALLMSATIADSRPLTEPDLGGCLTDPIRTPTRPTRFLRAMLDEALSFRPPTGVVRDFVVEHGGEHSGQLDLKKGGLAPIVALARWVAIATGDVHGSTPERLHRGADMGILTFDEAQSLAGAFEEIYALVLRHEVAALRAGATPTTFIAPGDLDTLHRRHLRESFRAVRAVQARIDEHWLARLDRIPGAG